MRDSSSTNFVCRGSDGAIGTSPACWTDARRACPGNGSLARAATRAQPVTRRVTAARATRRLPAGAARGGQRGPPAARCGDHCRGAPACRPCGPCCRACGQQALPFGRGEALVGRVAGATCRRSPAWWSSARGRRSASGRRLARAVVRPGRRPPGSARARRRGPAAGRRAGWRDRRLDRGRRRWGDRGRRLCGWRRPAGRPATARLPAGARLERAGRGSVRCAADRRPGRRVVAPGSGATTPGPGARRRGRSPWARTTAI